MVLVARDGAQYPPFDFPKGGHLLQFLTCIENGLQLAGGYIDPPLSTERSLLAADSVSLARRRSSLLNSLRDAADADADAACSAEVVDFVFRVIHPHILYQFSDDGTICVAVSVSVFLLVPCPSLVFVSVTSQFCYVK